MAGFISFEDRDTQTLDNFHHRQRMYKLLTGEVSAAVKSAKDGGADIIYVNDSHGSGYNILFEELESGCEIIHGRSSHFPEWLTELKQGCDVMVLIGVHPMGGELDGVCPHSKWSVNGGQIYLSEASMAMAMAGDLGIPAVFVSGYQVITGELKEKNPGIVTGVVKYSYGPNCCRSVLPARAQEIIKEGVRKGIEGRREIKPYLIKGPVTLNLLDTPSYVLVFYNDCQYRQ